jgi:DNA-binding response OmpR family regulator
MEPNMDPNMQPKRRVLIADDEPNIVISLEYLMTKHGYDVRVARDGDEVMSLIESFRPHVMLLDVMMPKRSGYEICQKVRENRDWKDTRIVILSAKGREAEVSKGLSLGADLYVTKPFSNHQLLDSVARLLDANGSSPAT